MGSEAKKHLLTVALIASAITLVISGWGALCYGMCDSIQSDPKCPPWESAQRGMLLMGGALAFAGGIACGICAAIRLGVQP